MEQSYKTLPPLAALKAFDVFGRVGGIRRTAKILDVDHAVISRHLRSLESRVGAILIERRSGEHGRWLTSEGAAYHQRVSAALMELASASDALNASRQLRLHIWCSPGFALHWLGKRLHDFAAEFPDVDVELRSSDAPPDLATNDADCDIRFVRNGQPASQGRAPVRTYEFARPEVFPVAAPAYLAAMATPITSPQQLCDLPLLHEDNEDEWTGWFRAHQLEPKRQLSGMRLWQAHLCLLAAREGQGIALANPLLVSDDLRSGRLVRIFAKPEEPQIELGGYHLIAREDRWNFTAISRFRRWLINTCPATA